MPPEILYSPALTIWTYREGGGLQVRLLGAIRNVPNAEQAHAFEVREICRAGSENGVPMIPLFHSSIRFSGEYPAGRDAVYHAAIDALQVPDEGGLTWEQVLQFRADQESLDNYRRFRFWLGDALASKSESEAQDRIELKLGQYEAAMKKHGISTVLSNFSRVLHLGSAAAVINQIPDPVLAWLVNGAYFGGMATLYLKKDTLDIDRKLTPGSEVALIYDARKRFGDMREPAPTTGKGGSKSA